MKSIIRVAVTGAGGRMGREVLEAVLDNEPEFALVGAADPAFAGKRISKAFGLKSEIVIEENIDKAISEGDADAVVVFSIPSAAMGDIRSIMKKGAVPVIGTTGITQENLKEIKSLSKKYSVGAIIAPNFAIGAVLMMKIAAEVAKHLPAAEIIELHHDRKLDAPSGTAIKTSEMIASARQRAYSAGGENPPARGGCFNDIHIHSVRLPGLIAHQEIIFGGLGQTLTIRHDSYDRKSFMPGVLMALRKAKNLKDVIYGLEHLL